VNTRDFGKPGVVQGQALFRALETFPTTALEELACGNEDALEVMKIYAKAVVRRRRITKGADSN
jgi:hypothetical protein